MHRAFMGDDRIRRPAVTGTLLILVLASLHASGPVQAASKSATIGFRLTVAQACEAGGKAGAAAVNFGTLDMGTVPSLRNQVEAAGTLSNAGAIRVKCAPGIAYKVFLGKGRNDTGAQRRMIGPQGGLIEYGLYQDSGHSRPWDRTNGVSGQGSGADALLPVYSVVKPQRTPVAGVYRDTVQVVVEW